MSPLVDLFEHNVVVTGASSGIGEATAVLLSELGAKVVLVGRNVERLQRTRASLRGEGHEVLPCDLGSTEQTQELAKRIPRTLRPVRGLVYAAGLYASMPFWSTEVRKMDELYRVNCQAAMLLAQALASRELADERGASLVFVASIAAQCGGKSLAIYGATKGYLFGAVKSLALEYAPRRIRFNCVAPAFVKTPMSGATLARMSPQQAQITERAHPLGFGEARDVAALNAFLLSDASRWITGAVIPIDGGYSAQ